MRAGPYVLIFTLAGALLAPHAAATSPGERLAGVNALAGRPAAVSAVLDVRRRSALAAHFDIVQKHGSDVVRDYDVDMTQRAHVIVIGDDFHSFQHLHPTLGADGHFRLDVRVARPGRYYVYADSEPRGLGQSVVRFTVPFGHAPPRAPELTAGARTVACGSYSASLDSLSLSTRRPTTLRVTILKRGEPAGDLRPYLGGAAHAVFIDARTLAYVHVHPSTGSRRAGAASAMSAMSDMPGELPGDARVAPSMRLRVPAIQADPYRLWLQFRGAGGLCAAPFVLVAR